MGPSTGSTIDGKLFGWWILANVGTAALTSMGILALASGQLVLAVLPLGGVALLQWLVLRGRLQGAGWWVLATVLGLGVGLFVALLPTTLAAMAGEGPLTSAMVGTQVGLIILAGALLGMTLGVAQWGLVLARRALPGSAWWPLVCAAGWGLAFAGLWGIGTLLQTADVIDAIGEVPTLLLASLVPGGALGAITGIVLVRLLRREQ